MLVKVRVERQQLGFVMLNGNLVVNLKTSPTISLLNGMAGVNLLF